MKVFITMLACLLWICRPASAEDFPDQVKRPVQESISVRQQTQKAQDQWSAERTKLEAVYDALKTEQTHLLALQHDLNKQVRDREAAIVSLETKIDEIARISNELMPYLEDVYAQYKRLIQEDLPFLAEERNERVNTLRRTLDDVQIPSGEKFRKVLEALLIEAEYGNTVEVYQERIRANGKEILVNIFRLGRMSLFFQSLDRKLTGYYNQAESKWTALPEAFNREIAAAVEMGTKRRSVDVVNLPIGRIVSK